MENIFRGKPQPRIYPIHEVIRNPRDAREFSIDGIIAKNAVEQIVIDAIKALRHFFAAINRGSPRVCGRDMILPLIARIDSHISKIKADEIPVSMFWPGEECLPELKKVLIKHYVASRMKSGWLMVV